MKKIKKQRIIGLLLILCLFISSLSLLAFAAEPTKQQILVVVDLSDYQGDITGAIKLGNSEVELTAGQRNEFLIPSAGFSTSSVTLTDFPAGEQTENYNCWTVSGLAEGFTRFSSSDNTYSIHAMTTRDSPVITMQGNTLTFVSGTRLSILRRKDTSWGGGTTVTISPKAPAKVDNVSAVSSDESKGTAGVMYKKGSTYGVLAKSAAGYAFDYWLRDNAEDTAANHLRENPYMVETTEAASFVAYFREPYHVTVRAEISSAGTQTAEYVNSQNGADQWRLSATPADGYEFDHWSLNDTLISSENPYTVNVTENTEFTAHYRLATLDLLDGAYLESRTSSTNIINPGWGGTRDVMAPYVGTRATLYVPFKVSAAIPMPKLQMDVYTASGTLVTSQTIGTRNTLRAGNNNTAYITLDSVPNTSALKVHATLRTTAGTLDPVEKTYEIAVNNNVAANDHYGYLTTPKYNQDDQGNTADAGPNIAGVYTRVNAVTKELEAYFYGKNGICSWDETGVQDLKGIGSGLPTMIPKMAYNGVIAVGPDGDDGLIAAVEVIPFRIDKVSTPGYDADSGTGTPMGNEFLYRWDSEQETWTMIPDSCFSMYVKDNEEKWNFADPRSSGSAVLILSGTDIWQNLYHWNGTAWSTHGYSFNSFAQFSAVDAWAGSENGLYHYDGSAWESVTTTSAEIVSQSPGYLLLKTGTYTYQRFSTESKAAEDLPSLVDMPRVDAQRTGMALDQFGEVYAFFGGRQVYTNIYADTDTFKLVDGQWQLQQISAYNDPNETTYDKKIRPAGVTAGTAPLSGLSFLYGPRGAGALYMYATQQGTITFDANGGTLSSSTALTGTVHDEIDESKVPSASYSGKSFMGWYYTKDGSGEKWDPTTARMPYGEVTLYAFWGDGNDLTYHREAALKSLKKQFDKYTESDYSAEKWQKLVAAYEQGIEDINNAGPAEGEYPENNIIDALNKALAAMQAITPDRVGKIDVVVSMDAQTLTLGYFIKPTIVTVDKNTPASVVISDLIIETLKEKYGDIGWEPYQTYHESEPDKTCAYMHTGTLTDSFYLAQVYWPGQENAFVPKYITDSAGAIDYDKYNTGNYLGEFDYHQMSGWMYSISNVNDSDLPSFPGVGAANWQMSDGDVMRWQFTVWGYGADLNADNSAWGQPSITGDSGDKTELTVMIAELRQTYGDDLLGSNETYLDVFDNTLCDPLANTEKLKAAVAKRAQIEEELADAYAAKKANQAIEDIGLPENVTLESKAAIEAARAAYDALTDAQKEIFQKKYPEALANLEAAEARYEELKQQAEQEEIDRAAAQEVIKLIDDIGGVDSVTSSSGPKLEKARKAYDALTDAQKALVTNYDVLLACEKAYADLPNPPTPPTPPTPSKPTTPSKPKDDKPTTGASFTDVPAGSWYEDAVNYVSEKGLMNGTSKNGFSPNATTTRGMIVTILARVEGVNTSGTPWYAAGQKWAMDNGISDGTNMVGEVTREQLAAILYRYAKLKGYDTSKSNKLDSFKDADKVSSWAVEAMQWANAESLINGKSNSMLDPQGKATRAETAAILMRFMQNIAK